MAWTTEQTETLKRLWLSIDYNIEMIAKEVGKHPSSTARKARRLKLGPKQLQTSDSWPVDKVAELRRLWPLREYSCADIGAAIGMSKGAVVGKAERLDLPTKLWSNSYSDKAKIGAIKSKVSRSGGGKSTTKGMRAALRVVELKQIATRVDTIASLDIGLLDLQEFHCRWVTGTGDDGLATYCGHEKSYRSYCAHHCAIAYETVSERRARAAKMKVAA